jgi:hypothetical protein
MIRKTFMLAALLATSTAFAQDTPKAEQIRAQQTQLRADLDAGKYRLTPRALNQVRKDQGVVFELLERKSTVEAMNIQERVNLDNALERINAAVQGTRVADDGKDVCRYQSVAGSRQKRLVCGTQDDRDHAREGARAYMEKPRICSPTCNGL